MLLGDAVITTHMSFEHPEWPFLFDLDPEKGGRPRRPLLDRAASDRSHDRAREPARLRRDPASFRRSRCAGTKHQAGEAVRLNGTDLDPGSAGHLSIWYP
jgi:hypothetical protein